MPSSPTRSWVPTLAAVSSGPMLAAGLLGGLVMELVGGPLATGFAIWSGDTTEPGPVDGGYWWGTFLALAAASIGTQLMSRKDLAGAHRWGPAVGAGTAIIAGVLPMVWLWLTSEAIG